MLSLAGTPLRDKNTISQKPSEAELRQEAGISPPSMCASWPSKPISPPRSLAPSVEPTNTGLGSSTCIYKRVVSTVFKGAESLNLSLGKSLGKGAYAEVNGVYCHSRKRLMALKVVNKSIASPRSLSKHLPREIRLLQVLSHLHPHIVTAHSIVETECQVFILMDLAENGNLAQYIGGRGRLPEPEACYLFSQFTEGIKFLHSKYIAHRDLKCPNILLDHNMSIKIADFGYGIDVSFAIAMSACGTYAYAAPELFHRIAVSYDALKADVWSMGVVLFAMVTGQLVFGDNNTAKKYLDRRVHFPPLVPLSDALKDLLLCMLRVDVTTRLASSEISGYAWMRSGSAVKPSRPAAHDKYTKASLDIQLECCKEQQPQDHIPSLS